MDSLLATAESMRGMHPRTRREPTYVEFRWGTYVVLLQANKELGCRKGIKITYA